MNKKTKPSLYSEKCRQNDDKDNEQQLSMSPKINEKKPWLYEDGTALSDKKLKLVSRGWTPDVWESYLVTLERESNEELLFDPQTSENISEDNYTDQLFATIKENSDESFKNLKTAVNRLLRTTLSKREFEVVDLIYWDGRTVSEAAIQLNICRRTIHVLLRRAHEKIASQLFKESLKRYKHLKDLGRNVS